MGYRTYLSQIYGWTFPDRHEFTSQLEERETFEMFDLRWEYDDNCDEYRAFHLDDPMKISEPSFGAYLCWDRNEQILESVIYFRRFEMGDVYDLKPLAPLDNSDNQDWEQLDLQELTKLVGREPAWRITTENY